jgi:hypothetical protein
MEAPFDNMKKAMDKKFTDASVAQAMQDFLIEINNRISLQRML